MVITEKNKRTIKADPWVEGIPLYISAEFDDGRFSRAAIRYWEKHMCIRNLDHIKALRDTLNRIIEIIERESGDNAD